MFILIIILAAVVAFPLAMVYLRFKGHGNLAAEIRNEIDGLVDTGRRAKDWVVDTAVSAATRTSLFLAWHVIITLILAGLAAFLMACAAHAGWAALIILLPLPIMVLWLYWISHPAAPVPVPAANARRRWRRLRQRSARLWARVYNGLRPDEFNVLTVAFGALAALFAYGNVLVVAAALAHSSRHNCRPLTVVGVLLAVMALEGLFLITRLVVQAAVAVVDFSEFTVDRILRLIVGVVTWDKDALRALATPKKPGEADAANLADQEKFVPAWRHFRYGVVAALYPVYVIALIFVGWTWVFFIGGTVGLVSYLLFSIQLANKEAQKLVDEFRLASARFLTSFSYAALCAMGLMLLIGQDKLINNIGLHLNALIASRLGGVRRGLDWLLEFFMGRNPLVLPEFGARSLITLVVVVSAATGLAWLALRSKEKEEWAPMLWARRVLAGLIITSAAIYLVCFGLGTYAQFSTPRADALTTNGFVLMRPDAPKLAMAKGGASVIKTKSLVWEADPEAQGYQVQYLVKEYEVENKKTGAKRTIPEHWSALPSANRLPSNILFLVLAEADATRTLQVAAMVPTVSQEPDEKNPGQQKTVHGSEFRHVDSSVVEQEEQSATRVRVEWPEARNAIAYKLERREIVDLKHAPLLVGVAATTNSTQPKTVEAVFGDGVTAWEGNHVENGKVYYYRLAAEYPGMGWSRWSPEVSLPITPIVATPAKAKSTGGRKPMEQAAAPAGTGGIQSAVAASAGDPCDKLTPAFHELAMARGDCPRRN